MAHFLREEKIELLGFAMPDICIQGQEEEDATDTARSLAQ